MGVSIFSILQGFLIKEIRADQGINTEVDENASEDDFITDGDRTHQGTDRALDPLLLVKRTYSVGEGSGDRGSGMAPATAKNPTVVKYSTGVKYNALQSDGNGNDIPASGTFPCSLQHSDLNCMSSDVGRS